MERQGSAAVSSMYSKGSPIWGEQSRKGPGLQGAARDERDLIRRGSRRHALVTSADEGLGDPRV